MHGKEAVPVIDLRLLRHAAPGLPHNEPAPVILCRGRGRPLFGLHIDELGQVLNVASTAVRPLAGYLSVHDRHAEGVLSFDGARSKRMLTLLSVEGLATEFTARVA